MGSVALFDLHVCIPAILLLSQPKGEPRPKKPRIERPPAERTAYADHDGDIDDPLAMEDDSADKDFELAQEVCWACTAVQCRVSRFLPESCLSHTRPAAKALLLVAPFDS